MKYDLAVEKAAHKADARADSVMFHYMQLSYIEQMEIEKHQRRREMTMIVVGVLIGGGLICLGARVE